MRKRYLLMLALFAVVILLPMVTWTFLDLEDTDWGGVFGALIFLGLALGGILMWNVLMRGFFRDGK